MKPQRRCLDCNVLTAGESLCEFHRRERRRRRLADRKLHRAIVRTWVAEHGFVCPGYLRAAHPSTDLTVDHVVPLEHGGADDGERQVLCRPCNSRKGSR